MRRAISKHYETLNRIELSRAAWLHNLSYLSELSDCRVAPVLKANAYGHGLAEVAQMSADADLPFIAVDGFHEALVVREHTKHEVLVLGAIDSSNFPRLAIGKSSFAVGNSETLNALCSLKKPVSIHLEIDTGMKRHGFQPEQLQSVLEQLKRNPLVRVDGVMSHFADADNPESTDFTDQQVSTFDEAVGYIQAAGFQPKHIHLAQSAGSTRKQSKTANTIRPGIVSYGVNPLSPSDKQFEALQKTKPIMQIVSRVGAVQKLQPGESISYSRTYVADSVQTIAVIPFGYYEGLPRALSNKARLKDAHGNPLPIRGRICMNHTMVDASRARIALGDDVIVVSANRNDSNSLQTLCDDFNLFNYEVLVHLASATRRVIVD